MRPRLVATILAQGALVAVLGAALTQAVETAPARPPLSPWPATQTAAANAWETRVVTLAPLMTIEAAFEQTEVAEVLAGQTPTPCPTPPTPVVSWHIEDGARCFKGFRDATATRAIETGETYTITYEWGRPVPRPIVLRPSSSWARSRRGLPRASRPRRSAVRASHDGAADRTHATRRAAGC